MNKLKKYRQYLILPLLTVAVLFLLFCFSPSFNYFTSIVSGSVKSLPIYSVDRNDNKVSISFDASWGAERTEQILDILDEYNVKATFFLVNIWIEDYPEMAQEIVARGHEIGLHSVSHPQFSTLSVEQIKEELQGNYDKIKEITGYEAKLFRPPFGDYNNTVIDTVREQGYIPIQWSVDSLDWKDYSAQEICNRVLKKISAGDIVLFHNNGLHTPEALPEILKTLQDKNLQVVPISELILSGDTYIDPTGKQKSK